MTLESSLVRIRTANGQIVGAGFLGTEEYILTCAHVVLAAVGKREYTSDAIGTEVAFDFPFLGSTPCNAELIFWQPPTATNVEPGRDIALLRLASPLPALARPAQLIVADNLFGRPFRAYGFPQRADPGVWAYGVLRDKLSNGWLQIEDVKAAGESVRPGFSGGPVEDQETETIIGMVIASTTDKVAFAIPASVLLQVLPRFAEKVSVRILTSWPLPVIIERYLHQYLQQLIRHPDYARWGVLKSGNEFSKAIQPMASTYRAHQEGSKPLLSILQACDTECLMVLLGEPGVGKTSALELCVRLLGEEYLADERGVAHKVRRVPIMVSLQDYRSGQTLEAIIGESIRRYQQTLTEIQLDMVLDLCPCVIFLDGLNEVSVEARDDLIKAIRRLITRYGKATFILTCRTADFADFEANFSSFVVLELAAWNLDQIKRFLLIANHVEPPLLSAIIEDPSFQEMMGNPFMLSLASEAGPGVETRSTQTGVVGSYLRSDKVVGQVATRGGIRQALLPTARRIAYTMRLHRQVQSRIDDILEEIEVLGHRRGYSSWEMFESLRQSGLIRNTLHFDSAAFTQEYLQEYLTAEYIVEEFKLEQVLDLAADSWWSQTVIFYLNLRKANLSADDFLRFLQPVVNRWVRYCAAEIVGDLGDPRLYEMVTIPAGSFVMGRDDGSEEERPAHRVDLPAYMIDRFPVTNIEYATFVRETGHPVPVYWQKGKYSFGRANHPVTGVTWHDAADYAAWAGKRLPSEAEWEKAASWFDDNIKFLWPWGNEFASHNLNSDTSVQSWVGGTSPVGVYLDGNSRYKLSDMCGNVWEWTAPAFAPYPYDPKDGRENPSLDRLRVVRGGSWRSTDPSYLTTTKRDAFTPLPRFGGNVGFRCVRDT